MNNFDIIGLTGAARTGKDTIADYLCSKYDYGRIAFADPIKRMVCALLQITPEILEANKDFRAEDLVSPRRMMQTLGTEWGRELISDDIWINLARAEIFRWRNNRQAPGVVITDCRFNNEARAILELDGELWQVKRYDAPVVESHASEGGIDPQYITRIIQNNGSFKALYDVVEAII